MENAIIAVGLPWYRKADYPKSLDIMADADLLPVSHHDWQQKAEHLERELGAKGMRTIRAIIDPQTFPAWCTARGLDINAKARTTFANETAYRQARQ
tara:strand:+ start:12509 stop:12799 length:291 start_codon:yes stop_codon:yes gene_type:complete